MHLIFLILKKTGDKYIIVYKVLQKNTSNKFETKRFSLM